MLEREKFTSCKLSIDLASAEQRNIERMKEKCYNLPVKVYSFSIDSIDTSRCYFISLLTLSAR